MKSYSGEHNILFYSDTREPLHIIFGGLIIKIVWYLERLISLHGLAGDGGKGGEGEGVGWGGYSPIFGWGYASQTLKP